MKKNNKKEQPANKDPAPLMPPADKKLAKDLEKICIQMATLIRDQAVLLETTVRLYKTIGKTN
jgi:hypothetical protein